MIRKAFILVFILVLGALAVLGQDNSANDPFSNDAANACAEGGAMEGKCNIDFDGNGIVDDYEVKWAWACGWYMIRYDAGIFAEVPSWCQSLIPPVIEPVVGTEEPSGPVYCYYAHVEGYSIYKIVAPGKYEYVDYVDLPVGAACPDDLPT